jgi:hypothetical protein
LPVTIHVEELSSEVSVEPPRPAQSTAGPAPPQPETLEAYRAMRERFARDADRTRAEGYGD